MQQHQVEHADVGLLVAEAGQAGLAVRHADRVEPGGGEVARHPLGDDVVILDDQHLGTCASCNHGPVQE